MGMYEKHAPVIHRENLTSSEFLLVQELDALANSSTLEFLRKQSGSIVNTSLAELLSLSNLSDVLISSPTSGQVLVYNGSAWVNSSDSGSGTVTSVSVVTANGLSGTVATANTTPAITLDISALDATKIADGSVTNTEFQYLNGVTSSIQTQLDSKGTGDVTGPASSTDNAITRFDGTTGKIIQNSGITIADGASGTLSGTNTGDQTSIVGITGTIAEFNIALTDGDFATGGGTATGTNTGDQNDHGLLDGLTDDDHTQYALLDGRSGGQTLIGGTLASNDLTLQSTTDATRGKVNVTDNFQYAAALQVTGYIDVTVGTNQNNWAPTGIGTASIIRITTSGAFSITGINSDTGGTPDENGNRVLTIVNLGAHNVTLVSESASSNATNRFNFPVPLGGQADFILYPGNTITLWGDGTTARWRQVANTHWDVPVTSTGINMNTARLLGRTTASTGAIEELTLSAVLDLIGSAAQGDILYRDSSTWARLGAGTANQVLKTGGASANPSWGLAYEYIKVSDVKAQNTAGGTFTLGAWRTRVINTEDTDTGGNCSISSNQITLGAGTYECHIKCPAVSVGAHQARLQNITDTATTLIGTAEHSSSSANYATCSSVIIGRFTITGSTVFEIQHQGTATQTTNGFGLPANFTSEVYTVAEFRKIL